MEGDYDWVDMTTLTDINEVQYSPSRDAYRHRPRNLTYDRSDFMSERGVGPWRYGHPDDVKDGEAKLTYAKAGGPPDDWALLLVFHADTGQEIKDVVEIDTEAGWIKQIVRDEIGRMVAKDGELSTEIVEGAFRLEYRR